VPYQPVRGWRVISTANHDPSAQVRNWPLAALDGQAIVRAQRRRTLATVLRGSDHSNAVSRPPPAGTHRRHALAGVGDQLVGGLGLSPPYSGRARTCALCVASLCHLGGLASKSWAFTRVLSDHSKIDTCFVCG